MSLVYVNGVKNHSEKEISATIRDVFLKATDNLAWLSKGDLVLLKPALNSPHPYPATCHPLSIKVIAEILHLKGARVLVGDQSGIEHVVHTPNGVIKGSSYDIYKKSGMNIAPHIKFIGFEEEDWHKDFFKYQSEKTPSWKNGFYITNWINKVDHIINLPRLSTHVQAGVSLGFKNLVGLLREDSRLEFHANGPFAWFMDLRNMKIGLKFNDDHTNNFFPKISEIYTAVKNKLRLTFFTATQAQVTFGPDKHTLLIFGRGILPAYVMTAATGLVFASSDLVASEIFATAFLTLLYNNTSSKHKICHKILLLFNRQAKELKNSTVWENPCVRQTLRLGLADSDIKVEYKNVPKGLKNKLEKLVISHP